MKIRIRPTDTKYSKIIRAERPICEVCKVRSSTQVHHFRSRNRENTRFDDDNVVSVCFKDHRMFHENPAKSCLFMTEKLGLNRFEMLLQRAEMYKKRDDKLDMIYLKQRESYR